MCYIPIPMSKSRTIAFPAFLARWELAVIVAAVVLLLVLALAGKGRRQREAYENFLSRAPKIEAALRAYAADHDGRFPPDAMFTGMPQGMGPYIDWNERWKIDYEAHKNGKGGYYVCMEFCGPYKERLYFGLCNKPEYRAKYGKGQPVPGKVNRLWVVSEDAKLMPRERPPRIAPHSKPPKPPSEK